MTDEEAKKMLKAKLECFKNETSGINHDCNMRLCDGCSLNYEQGNMGEQKEALETAIKALEQQQDKVIHNHPCEDCYYNDGDVHAECVVCDIPVEKVAEAFINDVESVKDQLDGQPCDDAVSRQTVIEAISDWITEGEYNYTNATNYLVRRINALSSVTSQPKSGEWIEVEVCNCYATLKCSVCDRVIEPTFTYGEYSYDDIKEWYPYCHCGCRMNGGDKDAEELTK